MSKPLRVLMVEDSEDDAFLLKWELRRGGYEVKLKRVDTALDLQKALAEETWDVILSDYNLPGFNGLAALRIFHQFQLDIPFILVSGAIWEEIAVEAMRSGAHDYIKKDNLSRLIPAIERELREAHMRQGRLQVEKLLDASQARYRTLVENIPIGVYRLTAGSEGKVIMANRTFLKLFGYSSLEDLAQVKVSELYAYPEEAEALAFQLLSHSGLSSFELQFKKKDNALLWGAVTATIIYDDLNQPAYLDCTIEDITERKRSEKLKEALYRISEAANTYGTLEEFLRQVHRIICELMPAKNFYMALYDPKTETVSFPYFVDEHDQKPSTLDLGKTMTGYIIRSGRPLLINPDTFEEMHRQGIVESVGTPSLDWMGVPLKTVENRTIGALVIQTYDEGVRYTERDRDVLAFVSSQTAMAVERISAELALREQRAFLRQVIDMSPNFIFAKDKQGRFILANEAVAQIYGTTVDNLIGKSDADFNLNLREVEVFHHDDMEVINNRQEKYIPEETITDSHGEVHWLQTVKRPLLIPSTDEVQVLGVATDITGRKDAEEKLLHNAFHDTLTGLPNRTLFLDRLSRVIERCRRHPNALFAVLLLDLDRFAFINDSFGHLAGDQLLIAASERLETCLRTTDTIARIGGDEFIIILEDLDNFSNVTQVAERLLEEMSKPFNLADQRILITTSIGVVLSASTYENPEEVLRDADIAMYRAKALGRGRYALFSGFMRADVIAQLELQTDFRQAIDYHCLVLHYEPIIHLKTRRLLGFEALVRWRHPKRGLIPPVEFISFAEETGLIIPMGSWVLKEACRQMKRWQSEYAFLQGCKISVNLSYKQFTQPNLVQQVEGILHETGLAPDCLRLEITESTIMGNLEVVISALKRLRTLGVQVDIDDFGTGYSSLVSLHLLPLNAIKIDRSFISGHENKANGVEIIKTIISLAKDLHLDTIAEGVETVDQLDWVKNLGCAFAQGFAISRGMDGAMVSEFIRKFLADDGFFYWRPL